MSARPSLLALLAFVCPVLLLGAACTEPVDWESPHEPFGRQLFTSPQSNPIALDGDMLYVANTTSNSISVVNTATQNIVENQLRVGLDPVGVAVRPDAPEVWVANHISDSISVIDANPASPSYLQILRTIQSLTGGTAGSTAFDEPVGIAFAEPPLQKAFVALSSTNEIAVIDTTTYAVTNKILLTAQEPRALAVRGNFLYVAAFESGNQTEISSCNGAPSPPDCTIGAGSIITFAMNPNLPGVDKNIIVDPVVPDRDLFVINATSEAIVDTVSGVGTLLYGVAAAPGGDVFVTQADARNAVNGLEGGILGDLDNRIFLNRIARIDCASGPCASSATQIELEDLPSPECGGGPCGADPAVPLATPYGIAASGDGTTLVATAAGSSRVFTVRTSDGVVLDTADVGSIPRGLVLRSDGGTGAPLTAYVLNTLDNSVSVVDVSDPSNISVTTTFAVGDDPTPDAIRRGRIAFNNANASSTGTFACGSCHPDGNMDQLLWRIGGACTFGACSGLDEARTTMPIRGLKHTLPLHWDGTLGDPFGGGNGAVGLGGSGGTDCDLGGPEGDHDCFFDLVQESLKGVMCDQSGSCPLGGNELSFQERDDMATFLASVAYPPSRARRIDDVVSASGVNGFRDFFGDQGGFVSTPNTCADMGAGCHAPPLGADTNSATLNGFDVPTMRGLYDRFVQFSLGLTGSQEALDAFVPSWSPAVGMREQDTFQVAFASLFQLVYNVPSGDIFQMIQEMSTGTSGATGRQVTISQATLNPTAQGILDALEAADTRGVINLRGNGRRSGTPMTFSYLGGGLYEAGPELIDRATLETEAGAGTLNVTFTGHLRANHGTAPEPVISPLGTPDEPVVSIPGSNNVTLVGVDVLENAVVFVNGAVLGSGTVSCSGGGFTPTCSSGTIVVSLGTSLPTGMHLLQVQNPAGPLSNEQPICEGNIATDCVF